MLLRDEPVIVFDEVRSRVMRLLPRADASRELKNSSAVSVVRHSENTVNAFCESAVRSELNPAIRRELEISKELHELKLASGRLSADDLLGVRPTEQG